MEAEKIHYRWTTHFVEPIKESGSFLKSNFRNLFLFALLFAILNFTLSLPATEATVVPGFLLSLLRSFTNHLFAIGIYLWTNHKQKNPFPIKITFWTIAYVLLISVSYDFMTTLGTFALVVPGIISALFFVFATQVSLFIQDGTHVNPFTVSYRLVRGNVLKILVLLLCSGLMVMIPALFKLINIKTSILNSLSFEFALTLTGALLNVMAYYLFKNYFVKKQNEDCNLLQTNSKIPWKSLQSNRTLLFLLVTLIITINSVGTFYSSLIEEQREIKDRKHLCNQELIKKLEATVNKLEQQQSDPLTQNHNLKTNEMSYNNDLAHCEQEQNEFYVKKGITWTWLQKIL